jgi:catechol 2,3-dioxygenase-like lactoylglutathione lyase family enzyme
VRFRLDHVVIAVTDLEGAIVDYRRLGFTVERGGRHPGRTSHNALVVFEDGAYLELIAWEEPNPAERWNVEHLKHGDGFMDFALIPDDVPRAVALARVRGLAVSGPTDGGRVRPDGEELKWQTARQSTFDLPFLCGDVTPRELRVPEGHVRRHANGAAGVATLVVAVHDVDASLARYEALLGSKLGAPFALPGLGVRIASIALDATTLVLMSPLDPTAGAFPRDLARRLADRGEGPCALQLRNATPGEFRRLDLSGTHGALIEMGSKTPFSNNENGV